MGEMNHLFHELLFDFTVSILYNKYRFMTLKIEKQWIL
nr:MAG TPA: hypothetical protein [Caudoviricetes sp.]